MPHAAADNCIGTAECLRRYARSNVWCCGIPCDRVIQEAGSRLCRRIVFYSTMVIVAIAAIVGLVALQLRQSALYTGHAAAANLSAAFGDQVRRVLDSVSGAMERIKQRVEDGGSFDLAQWTRLAPELAGQPINAAVVGPDGAIRAGSLGAGSHPANFAGEDCFVFQRDNPDGGLFIARPAQDPATRRVTLYLTRRLDKPGGGFAGVLIFSIDPDFLTPLHRAVDLGQTGVMTLAGLDGIIRARHTGPLIRPVSAGISLAGSPSIAGAARAERGSYTGVSGLDGVDQIVDWRKIRAIRLWLSPGSARTNSWQARPGSR